jgi:hypothetical protein
LRELGLCRADLVRRASYKNIAKGLRRLDELCAGELDKTKALIRALPAALDVAPEAVVRAIEQTRSHIAQAEETARLVALHSDYDSLIGGSRVDAGSG